MGNYLRVSVDVVDAGRVVEMMCRSLARNLPRGYSVTLRIPVIYRELTVIDSNLEFLPGKS